MKKFFLFSCILLFFTTLFLSGCGSDDTISLNDDPVYDKYVAYIGVLDWNNGGKLLFIDREKLEYSFSRSVRQSPESLAYYRPNRHFYAGCGDHISSVYASRDSNITNSYKVGSALLACDWKYLYASFINGDFVYYSLDQAGNIYEEGFLTGAVRGAQMAVSGAFVYVSGCGSFYNDIDVIATNAFLYKDTIHFAADAGITASPSGKIFAVHSATKKLNMILPDTATVYATADLASRGAVAPWGVACAGSKVYVTDYTALGSVFVYDENLNFLKRIDGIGNFPKYISGDPEQNYVYVSNQGDGYGGNASLAIISPNGDFKLKTIGLDGHKPMDIAVMPWGR